jgi:hypothetical protein
MDATYLWILHKLLLPLLYSSRRHIRLVLGGRSVFGCFRTSDRISTTEFSYYIRASSPTRTKPSFSLIPRSSFIWSAWSRSTSFSLIAASNGRDWLAPMFTVTLSLNAGFCLFQTIERTYRSWSGRHVERGAGHHGMRRLSYRRQVACKGLVPAPLM